MRTGKYPTGGLNQFKTWGKVKIEQEAYPTPYFVKLSKINI